MAAGLGTLMKVILVTLMLAGLALAGCSTTPPEGGDDFVVPDQDDQGRYVIKMTSSSKFAPANAKVPAGSTVVWINEGGTHNTVSDDGLWESDMAGASKKENYEHTFESPGSYRYHCHPHISIGMKGVIKVE
jgi:plastocyanin